MVDDLDAALERAAPERTEAKSPPGRAAQLLALDTAVARPRWRPRWGLTAVVAGALLFGGGATAIAAPTLFDWSWDSADTLAAQEFPVGDNPAGQRCVMALWANADPGASDEVNAAVEKAQTFLHDQDWSSLDDDSTNMWAKQRKMLVADGSATPELLASLTATQVRDELDEAGLIVPGIMISTRVDCRDGAGE